MRKTWMLPLLLALLAAGSRGEEKIKTVKALRYTILTYASAMDAVHGAGIWRYELYFPDKKVVCNVEESYEAGKDGRLVARSRTNAFYGDIRHRYVDPVGGKVREQPTTEVEVPVAVAQKIFELAELTRRQQELAEQAAKEIGQTDLLPATLPELR
jgi:hypothetical protein